jgi:hypothetical protein
MDLGLAEYDQGRHCPLMKPAFIVHSHRFSVSLIGSLALVDRMNL